MDDVFHSTQIKVSTGYVMAEYDSIRELEFGSREFLERHTSFIIGADGTPKPVYEITPRQGLAYQAQMCG